MPVVMNKQAWEILSKDEQLALSLQLGMDKSSWESGEIMAKSHYKYLEIKYRAEHFLKMFTEHLELYDFIIPEYVTGDKLIIHYFRLCIQERKKPLEAIKELTLISKANVHKPMINERIIKQLKIWDNEDNAHNKTIHNLVKDFDRWNNFRILPKECQEPSAFKRRVKNAYKKQIRTVCSIHELAIKKIKRLYRTKKCPSMYIPLISNRKVKILRLRINRNSLNVVNTIGLYAFNKKKDAKEYIHALYHYLGKGKKNCNDGLEFWPMYRAIIQRARNYGIVMQISASRKYLQYAMQKLEFV